MRAAGDEEFAGSIAAHPPIETQLERILNADRGAVFAVCDDDGNTLGALPREAVIDLLSSAQGEK